MDCQVQKLNTYIVLGLLAVVLIQCQNAERRGLVVDQDAMDQERRHHADEADPDDALDDPEDQNAEDLVKHWEQQSQEPKNQQKSRKKQQQVHLETGIRSNYPMSDQVWRQVKEKFDKDSDGKLSVAEARRLLIHLELHHRHKKDSGNGSGLWNSDATQKGLYVIMAVAVTYAVYVWWRRRKEQQESVMPAREDLRNVRLTKYGDKQAMPSGTTEHGMSGSPVGRDSTKEETILRHRGQRSQQDVISQGQRSAGAASSHNISALKIESSSQLRGKVSLNAPSSVTTTQMLVQASDSSHTDNERTDQSNLSPGTMGVNTGQNPKASSSNGPNKQIKKKESQNVHKRKGDKRETAKNDANTYADVKIQAVPVSEEEKLLAVLSQVLGIHVKIKSEDTRKTNWSLCELLIKRTDLPMDCQDPSMKTHVLFSRCLARERAKKLSFCCQCHERCELVKQEATPVCPLIHSVVGQVQEACVKGLLDYIQESVLLTTEADDFWASVTIKTTGEDLNTVLSQFMAQLIGVDPDGVYVGDAMLRHVLSTTVHADLAHRVMVELVQAAGHQLQACHRMDNMWMSETRVLRGLERLLKHPLMVPITIEQLKYEIDNVGDKLGSYFEEDSMLGTLLAVSTVPPTLMEGTDTHSPKAASWTSLQGFPGVRTGDLHALEAGIQGSIHKIQELVFHSLRGVLKKDQGTGVLWLARLVAMNELRTTVVPQTDMHSKAREDRAACSDGFMVNVCSVLLELCLPFCQGDHTKVAKLDPAFAVSRHCPLAYDFENCLAGSQIVQEEEIMEGEKNPAVSQKATSESSGNTSQKTAKPIDNFNFMTKIFHITQRAMNVGFLPAYTHLQKLQQFLQTQRKALEGSHAETVWKAKQMLLTLRWDCSLLDTELLRKGTQFYLTQARWLLMLLDSCKQDNTKDVERLQRSVLGQIPEFIVKDMATWFTFLVSFALQVHPGALAGLQLSDFVDCCVTLLCRPDLMPGPIPAYRMIQALLAFVDDRGRQRGGSWTTRTWGSGVMSDLSAMVHTSPAVQHHLGPVLIRAYVSMDVVEGLDVDKEDFDKYGARADIGCLLENLWTKQDCKASVLSMCGSDIFQSFLEGMLNTLLYQLHDSLGRLANVRKLQAAKDNALQWNALPMKERQDKERFLLSEERVAKGFMLMATKTLGLISLLSMSQEVAECFTLGSLSQRTAAAFIGFLESLCGAKAVDVKVKDMEKYSFNPRQLLVEIIQILLRLACLQSLKGVSFVQSLAADPDYKPQTMQKALSVMQKKGLAAEQVVEEFTQLVDEIALLHEAHSSSSAETPGSRNDNWQIELDSMTVDPVKLKEEYLKHMGAFRFNSAEIEDSHSFTSNAAQVASIGSAKAKTLMKEMKQWGDILPVHPHASVFIVQDEERMDLVRALVTGPLDTPYSLGCFVFDIYCPAAYPNIPPLVKLVTTGNGVRFNPNLYADGKVCLSLLGTWHSGDASQKWNPSKSSLYQVLVSIQSMILIPDPMFNEPGYESMQDTQEGKARSREYNAKLRLYTVRHAMVGQLQQPTPGLENVIQQHFKLQRHVVLKQCSDWLRECQDKNDEHQLRQEVDKLRIELDKLDTTDE